MSAKVIHINGFNSLSLRLMRNRYGYSLRKLANLIGYSQTTISKWENGKNTPTNEAVARLATVFNVENNFFSESNKIFDFDSSVFFRRGAVVPKRNTEEAKAKERLFSLADQSLTKIMGLKTYHKIGIENTSTNFKVLSREFICHKANELRKYLHLEEGPINNVTTIVEKLGIRVCFSNLDSVKIDAVTGFIDKQPYIILNSQRLSSVRIRFNLAHELGHIILHSNYPIRVVQNMNNRATLEHEANEFANNFLLPDISLTYDMEKTNMKFLLGLKKKWHVSLQAIIYKGNEIGLISDEQALFLRQTISRNHWRINEPLDKIIPIEYPTFYKTAIEILNLDKKRLVSDVSEDTGLMPNIINNLIYYPSTVKTQYQPLHLVK